MRRCLHSCWRRGERNSSLNLPLVVREIAALKQTTAEEVMRVTTENAKGLLTRLH